MSHPNISKVIHAASKRGLFVMVEGSGFKYRYTFWDKKTGKWAGAYFPATKGWIAQGNRDGQAEDYKAAISAILDTVGSN